MRKSKRKTTCNEHGKKKSNNIISNRFFSVTFRLNMMFIAIDGLVAHYIVNQQCNVWALIAWAIYLLKWTLCANQVANNWIIRRRFKCSEWIVHLKSDICTVCTPFVMQSINIEFAVSIYIQPGIERIFFNWNWMRRFSKRTTDFDMCILMRVAESGR